MEALLVLVLLGGFVAVLGATLVVSRHSKRPVSFPCGQLQGHLMPHRRRTVLFSKAERSFYQALRSLVPDHMIFVKVKLADLVSTRHRQSVWDHFSPLNRERIDFVVCDPTMAPVVAIALDDIKHSSGNAATLDLVNSVLATASLPLVHVPQKRNYLYNELRRLLVPYLAVPRPLL
jgi:hypothetical protein